MNGQEDIYDFNRLNLESEESEFQHKVSHTEKEHVLDQSFTSAPPLQYRNSVSSNASSLSRNSTVSSSDTQYYTSPSRNSTILDRRRNYPPHSYDESSSFPLSPTSTSPPGIDSHLQHFQFTEPLIQTNTIDPNGCFVPCKSLPFIQNNDTTSHHYIVPTFAMVGQNQADVMKLLFNYDDVCPHKPREEFERTIALNIDQNTSLITLSQFLAAGIETPITKSYLLGLGQRLGITSIVVIISIEAIKNVYPLLDNLKRSMQINTPTDKQQPTWWSRVILVVNQQYGVNANVAYEQRKSFIKDEMPRIQQVHGLNQPLSVLFLSTQIHDNLPVESKYQYKTCCQRILWQMMQKHTLSGRWCSEIASLQNRINSISSAGATINILTEEDESSSSSDEAGGPTVINIVDFKVVKPKKKKKEIPQLQTQLGNSGLTSLQRRSTRRGVQKLHCLDGDDGTTLPQPFLNI